LSARRADGALPAAPRERSDEPVAADALRQFIERRLAWRTTIPEK